MNKKFRCKAAPNEKTLPHRGIKKYKENKSCKPLLFSLQMEHKITDKIIS